MNFFKKPKAEYVEVVMPEKYKHYDDDLEFAIIGGILLEKDALPKVYPYLNTIHFYDKRCQIVYGSLKWMFEKGMRVDLLIVANLLMQKKSQKWKDTTSDSIAYFLTKCTTNVVSGAHIEEHSLIVRQLYIARILFQQRHRDYDGIDELEAASETKKLIDDAFNVGAVDTWLSFEEVITKRLLAHMDSVKGKETIGAMTGFPSLDRHTQGVQDGEFVIIGARPSMGKTAFAMQMAMNMAKNGVNVGVVSLETQSQRLAARVLSGESKLEYWKIWQNKMEAGEESLFNMTMGNINNIPLFISDKASVSAMELKIAVHKLRRKTKGKLIIVIDYLQLLSASDSDYKGNRNLEIGEISRTCRILTLEVANLGIVALAQLGRAAETDGEKKPKMRHLRESGNLEQDADKIWMLHRDRDNESKLNAEGFTGDFDATIGIEKNKEGWCGEVPLKFKAKQMFFYEDGLPVYKRPSGNAVFSYNSSEDTKIDKNEMPF